jgi:DNA-binding MarR family transcriptional regulator
MDPTTSTCDQVVTALRSIVRSLDMHYKFLLRTFGLSGPQIIVLKTLQSRGPRPISEIAREVHLSHATVTDILDRMEHRNLVIRTPGAEDRRQVFVSLTDKGADMIQKSPMLLHEKFIAEFTGLELWEQNQILSSLQRVAAMIGTTDEITVPLLSIAPLRTRKRRSRSDAVDPAPEDEEQ